MAAKQIIKGDDLMLFYGTSGKSLAYATSHTLSISGDAVDTTTKDHGKWGGNVVNKLSWEITSENLFTSEDYATLFDAMTTGDKVKVVFGICGSHTDADGLVYDHTVKTTVSNYEGYAYITSLTSNANTGENATFSITLTGSGKLEHKGSASA